MDATRSELEANTPIDDIPDKLISEGFLADKVIAYDATKMRILIRRMISFAKTGEWFIHASEHSVLRRRKLDLRQKSHRLPFSLVKKKVTGGFFVFLGCVLGRLAYRFRVSLYAIMAAAETSVL